MSRFPFVGTFNGNSLNMNANRRSTLIVGSPVFEVNFNQFTNPASSYDLEAEYNHDDVLDASQNYWSKFE
jgi:hypothetical protein